MLSEKEVKELQGLFNTNVFNALKTETERGIITNVVSTGLLHTMVNIFSQVMKTVVGEEDNPDEVSGSGADDSIDIIEGTGDE